MQHQFLNKYCSLFDSQEENKLIYSDIFNQYVGVLLVYTAS